MIASSAYELSSADERQPVKRINTALQIVTMKWKNMSESKASMTGLRNAEKDAVAAEFKQIRNSGQYNVSLFNHQWLCDNSTFRQHNVHNIINYNTTRCKFIWTICSAGFSYSSFTATKRE